MSGRLARIVPYVLLAGAIVAVATGLVAVRIVNTPGTNLYIFLNNLAYWLVWTAFAPVVLYLGMRYRLVSGALVRGLAVHGGASVLFAALHLAIVTAVAAGLRAWLFHVPLSTALDEIRVPMRIHVEWEITMYWALVGLAHAISFRADARERELRAAQLEARLVQAQLQALQRQLQPHFLFNSLHTIAALVHRDVAAADAMIERLGDLLRMTLSAGDAAEVSLARELEHVRHYVAIEQANMGQRLAVSIEADPETLGASVPVLLLQPLVENAIRHGLAPRAAGGHVRIAARRTGDVLALTVQDDGLGVRAGGSRSGIGLENARQRLRQLYGDAQSLTVESPPGGGAVVSIRLPFVPMTDRARAEVPA